MPKSLIIGNILMAIVFAIKFNTLPPQIPLFYSYPWGEAQITDWWVIFLLPVLMNGLTFLNLALQRKFFAGNEFVTKTIVKFNLALMIIFTFVFIKILFLIA